MPEDQPAEPTRHNHDKRAIVEAQLKDAEHHFRTTQEEAKRNFYEALEKARAEVPPEGRAEVDEAERIFRDEHERAAEDFYRSVERVRELELGTAPDPRGTSAEQPSS